MSELRAENAELSRRPALLVRRDRMLNDQPLPARFARHAGARVLCGVIGDVEVVTACGREQDDKNGKHEDTQERCDLLPGK